VSGYTFGKASEAELVGVHPALVEVCRRALVLTTQDFSVHEGLRDIAVQRQLVKRGASLTLNSLHLTQSDGFGHAVDLVPYVVGRLRWEWPLIYPIALAMRAASLEHETPLIWGGVWDRPLHTLNPADLAGEVAAYVKRRKKSHPGKSVLTDGPHYQLA